MFSKSEWVVVDARPTTIKTGHARTVRVWALRSWIEKNTMNGQRSVRSAFTLSRIYADFQKENAGILPERCTWEIGEKAVNADVRQSIKDGQGKLYGIKVVYIPNAVGAILRG